MKTQTTTGIKFHNCTAKEFRIDGTWTDETKPETANDRDYDFTIIYNNYTEFQNGGADNTTLLWTDDNCPDDSSDIEHEIIAQFKQELPELLKQAELTQTEHPVTLTPEQLELIAHAWKSAYSEDIMADYSGFWKMIGGKLTDDYWLDKYTPIKNHLDDNASFDGCYFETYGEELDYVREFAERQPKQVWTVVDAGGHLYIIAGYHHVNRINYLLTQEEWDDSEAHNEYFIS